MAGGNDCAHERVDHRRATALRNLERAWASPAAAANRERNRARGRESGPQAARATGTDNLDCSAYVSNGSAALPNRVQSGATSPGALHLAGAERKASTDAGLGVVAHSGATANANTPHRTRTCNPLIKSQLLYRLS